MPSNYFCRLLGKLGVECKDCVLRCWVRVLPTELLIPILRWLLRQHCGDILMESEFADLRRLPRPPSELSKRIHQSVELYPCDLLFVHRDAERESIDKRMEEIREALRKSELATPPPTISVVPVRMQEAWLLINEAALRQAAGNPNSSLPLSMPEVNKLEELPNPKEILHNLMRQSSGLQGRNLDQFNRKLGRRLQQLADEIDDFRPLRGLAAFRWLEEEIERVAKEEGWVTSF